MGNVENVENRVYGIQLRINWILNTVALITLIYNFFSTYFWNKIELTEILANPSFFLVFLVLISLLVIGRRDRNYARVYQVVVFFVFATISTLEKYYAFYGIGQFVIAIFLAYQYGFLEKRIKLKLVVLLAYIIVVSEISATADPEELSGRSITVVIFIVYFCLLIYSIYRNEIQRILYAERSYNNQAEKLEAERIRLHKETDTIRKKLKMSEEQINLLDAKLAVLNNEDEQFDLDQFGVSDAEKRVIEVLCTFGESNNQLASRLGISVGTVKVHLSNIYKKTGIEGRVHLIELCRKNFL